MEEQEKNIPAPKSKGQSQKFLKNDRYFTVCIYVFVLVVISSIAIKAIFFFSLTKKFFTGLFRAVSPFLIALLIAYILTPFVRAVYNFLKKCFKKLPDKLAMVFSLLIVYILGIGLIITLLVYVLPELVRNIGELIGYIPTAYNQLEDLIGMLQKQFPDFDFSSIMNMLQNTQSDVMSGLQDVAGDLIPVLYTASVSIITWLGNFIIAVIVSIYMLYGRPALLRMLKIIIYAMIPRERVPKVKEIIMDCHHIFSNFLVNKMIDSLLIGLLCALLMTILRMPYVVLISTMVGVTNMIPYFGPFIGAIPGIVIILVVSPIKALIFAIMILCLQQFDGLVLGPKLLGSATGMKPIWIIFAITIGGKFFGVIGMFLGVPTVAIIAYLAERYMRYRLARKGLDIDEIT